MTSAQQMSALAGANCEVAVDDLTRHLYATDASLYRIVPAAVGFPRNTAQASALVLAAAQAGLSVIPRGAGTGLAGGAIGDGLVIDFARHNRRITDLDLERRTVRVGPGVILDQLNAFLKPYGFMFGPDVATSSRATLGGMIANNSSGARVLAYGATARHVAELEIVLANGSVALVGPGHDTLRPQRELIADIVYFHALEIEERFHSRLRKRFPGYGVDGCLREPDNLNWLISGSEGTLAAITSAELRIVPLPEEKGLALLFFASVAEAMRATVELMDLRPCAVEHVDRVLLDQTLGKREFQAARDLLELDHQPCQAVLMVEFQEEVADRLAAVSGRRLGLRHKLVTAPREMALVWALRKAGLNLLTSRPGDAKPVTCVEDAAVEPARLPAYVGELQKLMARLGLQASFYGHAAAGLLHVRPVLDPHSPGDVRKMRELADGVSALIRHFRGSLAGEHGVGIARTEYMQAQLGDGLFGVMRQIKRAFDPHNLFNPGKIVPDGRYRLDADLRLEPGRVLKPPFEPVLAFAARDGSFIRNLEQCNGCGVCLKEAPAMCPTFQATGREFMSTRGRANALRAAFGPNGLDGADPLLAPELDAALENCLSCRACISECPSNVNLPLLKAEVLHARIRRDGLGWRARVFSLVDWLGFWGCLMPRLANRLLDSTWPRGLLARTIGLAWQRPLPPYTRERFDRWFRRRPAPPGASRGRVILWDDTFVRYHEPHIGKAAVRVLEAAGFEVVLAGGRKCCGRPAFSQGHLSRVKKLGAHNLALLSRLERQAPVLFLEPSCYSMFVEDYRELRLAGASEIASRCFLFEQFIEGLLGAEPDALRFHSQPGRMVIHAHCHLKSLMDPQFLQRLAARLPGREVALLDTGCCGMAGAFGATESKYELSLEIAQPLITQVRGQPYGTVVVASGTSCRQQIDHLAPVKSRHLAEVLAQALDQSGR